MTSKSKEPWPPWNRIFGGTSVGGNLKSKAYVSVVSLTGDHDRKKIEFEVGQTCMALLRSLFLLQYWLLSASTCQALYYNFSLTDNSSNTATVKLYWKPHFIQVQLEKNKGN